MYSQVFGTKMKIRLSWKFFGVMMLNAILIVGVMVVIANLLISREFQGYIKASNLERFQIVKESLQEYYSLYGNWNELLSAPGSLGHILGMEEIFNPRTKVRVFKMDRSKPGEKTHAI